MAPLVQTRVTTLAEVPRYVDFLFLDEAPSDEASWAKTMKDGAGDVLAAVIDVFETAPWTAEVLKPAVEDVGEARGLSKSKAQAPGAGGRHRADGRAAAVRVPRAAGSGADP